MNGISLVSTAIDALLASCVVAMKDSTLRFTKLMEQRYGPQRRVGRGNILNFGKQIATAIGNSKCHAGGTYFFAIQSDILSGKVSDCADQPLGAYAALICGDERTVIMLPQTILCQAMAGSPTDRINVVYRDGGYSLRVTGQPLLDVTAYLNRYPTPGELTLAEPDMPLESPEQQSQETRDHTRIQWMLIKFGLAGGYSVWVPPSDRHREFDSDEFADMTIGDLPNLGFDPLVRQIIANIDVLWIDGNVIHKAFEIEATTSIYSGLLRLSDLVLSQPNINIALHLVAPLRRRDVVRKNALRPTFSRLRLLCSYISFEEIMHKYDLVKAILAQHQTQIRDLLESEAL